MAGAELVKNVQFREICVIILVSTIEKYKHIMRGEETHLDNINPLDPEHI